MTDARSDCIQIRDLEVECIVGINPEERVTKQRIVLNLTLYADLSRAGASDALADTVDYKAVKKAVLHALADSHFFLIERMAERVAEIALEFPIDRVDVCVDKPGALRFARSVAVEISRGKKT